MTDAKKVDILAAMLLESDETRQSLLMRSIGGGFPSRLNEDRPWGWRRTVGLAGAHPGAAEWLKACDALDLLPCTAEEASYVQWDKAVAVIANEALARAAEQIELACSVPPRPISASAVDAGLDRECLHLRLRKVD